MICCGSNLKQLSYLAFKVIFFTMRNLEVYFLTETYLHISDSNVSYRNVKILKMECEVVELWILKKIFKMVNFACPTCFESFKASSNISSTPCGHVFHTDCISKWLQNGENNSCSQCRKHCEAQDLNKLYLSEFDSGMEFSITVLYLELKLLSFERSTGALD